MGPELEELWRWKRGRGARSRLGRHLVGRGAKPPSWASAPPDVMGESFRDPLNVHGQARRQAGRRQGHLAALRGESVGSARRGKQKRGNGENPETSRGGGEADRLPAQLRASLDSLTPAAVPRSPVPLGSQIAACPKRPLRALRSPGVAAAVRRESRQGRLASSSH